MKKISSTETTVFVYDGGGTLVAEYSTELAATQQVSYLTTDHLGSPRVITNEYGAVSSRKDYSAFGEESTASQRSSGLGYQAPNIRQDYTGYQKDSESGLEFAQARYYNPTHGRFTSIDPMTASASIRNPQTFNRYSYVLNSPYKFTDPLGLLPSTTGACGDGCPNSPRESYGGSGHQWSAIDDDIVETEEGIASASSDSDFGSFIETGVGSTGVSVKSADELLGTKIEIDGQPVFVQMNWAAVAGDLYIKGTNTSVRALRTEGEIEISIVDAEGKSFKGKEASKSSNSIKKQIQKLVKSTGLSNVANCHGTTFAGGKYWIPEDQINGSTMKVLGYENVTGQPPQENDVGLFMKNERSVHSVRFNSDTSTVRGKSGLNPFRSSVAVGDAWNEPGTLEIWRKIANSKK